MPAEIVNRKGRNDFNNRLRTLAVRYEAPDNLMSQLFVQRTEKSFQEYFKNVISIL